MGSKRSAPPPPAPDPVQTARAQSAGNVAAATTTNYMNMFDQDTPDGSLRWEKVGGDWLPDGFGSAVWQDRWKATQTLSPTQMQSREAEQRVDRDTNLLAEQLLGQARTQLATPVDYSEDAIAQRTQRMVNPRLEERFSRDRAALETALINRGVRQGSQAYTDAITDFEKGRTDAFTQEGLANRQQAIQELGMSNREIINTMGALLGTGQIGAPQFTQTPRSNVAAPDYAGMVYKNYDAAMDAWKFNQQQRQQSGNAAMGGLFGLGGSVIGALGKLGSAGPATGLLALSDRRTKKNIEEVGKLKNGLPVYAYEYIDGGPRQIGVMAQDVEKKKPDAVHEVGGFKMVDYLKATEA